MDWFGARCKPGRAGREHFDVDDAFSAHPRRPLTGKTLEWKLRAFL